LGIINIYNFLSNLYFFANNTEKVAHSQEGDIFTEVQVLGVVVHFNY